MAENPLKIFEKLDPKLLKLVEDNRQLALSDGVLPKKFKLLIAMVLDASQGAVGGVTSLARAAMQAGASKEEIAEALRVATISQGLEVFTQLLGLSMNCSNYIPNTLLNEKWVKFNCYY